MVNNQGLGLIGLLVAIPLIIHIIKQTEKIGEVTGLEENKKKGGKNAKTKVF